MERLGEMNDNIGYDGNICAGTNLDLDTGDGHAHDEREPRSLTAPSSNRDQEEKTVPQVFLPRH